MQRATVTLGRLAILEVDDPRWDAFVANHPDATPFHQPAWTSLLADCYRFRSRAAVLVDGGGAILAGLPLMEIGRLRRRWVSLPFTDRCGPLVSGGVAPIELAHRIDEARSEFGALGIEIRDDLQGLGWSKDEGHWHELDLTTDPDQLFKKLQTLRRRLIRRAARERVIVERGRSRDDVMEVFYRLHVATRRRLGVPVQPRRFFELLWERMLAPGLGFLLIARQDGVPIASALFLAAKGRVIYKFSASDRSYGNLGATDALLWRAIEESCRDGARTFDFGRTEAGNEGLRMFKLGWGARENPLRYTVLGPMPPAERSSAAHRLLRPLIRRSPTGVARAIGTIAYRYTA